MGKRDENQTRVLIYAQPPGTCLHLHSAGILTGYGSSHYHWEAPFFGPHLVVRGEGTFTWPGGSQKVTPGSMFCLLPGMRVEYWENPRRPWQYYWLEIYGAGILEFARGCGFTPNKPVWHAEVYHPIADIMHELWQCLDTRQPAHPYTIQAKLYTFARLCAEASGALPRALQQISLIDRACGIIDSQLHTGLNVSDLAACLGVSRTTLFNLFKEKLGISPVEYLREQRIRRAREMLARRNDLSIREIARACGFTNSKYFLRLFKQCTGRTPSQWRADPPATIYPE